MKLIRYSKVWCLITFGFFLQNNATAAEPDYPRTMAVAIGIPAYYDQTTVQQNLSKADVLVLGFWPRWKIDENKSARKVVQAIKARNPNILIGQYTNLNEAKGSENPDKNNLDIAQKLDKEKWWLKSATGSRIQHTTEYGAWEINATAFTQPDSNNHRYPQWLAQRNYATYFQNTPEFDFWFLDISVPQSPVAMAQWENNGVPVLSALPLYAKAYRDAHVSYWSAIRNLQPQTLLVGNASDLSSTEYKGKLDGGFLEAIMGLAWSTYERKGWEATRQQYYKFMEDTKGPKIVGFNVWGAADDYQKMRFGLTTCLLNNGYFSYTDAKQGYGTMIWFDEYDAKLGKPTETPPTAPWRNGVYKRSFENGLVLVNPTSNVVHVVLDKQYKRLSGTQAPSINTGKVVKELDIGAKDGIILSDDHSAPTPPPLQNVTPIK